jgi:hypothetical protein
MRIIIKIYFLIIILSGYYFCNAQVIGVIYNKSEADQKYGSVLNSVEMESNNLDSLLQESGNYLMFNIKDENLYILGTGRNPLYPKNISITPDEVFVVVSTSKVEELINKGQGLQTFFEKRKDVFSVTNGNYTLEEIAYCPPFCN